MPVDLTVKLTLPAPQVDLMVSKRYPKEDWNVTSKVGHMENATGEGEEEEGVWITFEVRVEPQRTNTSKTIRGLAESFVYFNRMGTLQIAPDSVLFKGGTGAEEGGGVGSHPTRSSSKV